jgi:type IV secretion system protein TrbG
MDTRRLLTVSAAACLATACAGLSDPATPSFAVAAETPVGLVPDANPPIVVPAPVSGTARPYLPETAAEDGSPAQPSEPDLDVEGPARTGRAAIAAANVEARAASRSDQFVGGVQVFGWAPGRVYEVWTAPLRVTTLTLGPGETVVSKAAGDTVRWQIGEATSGQGKDARTHIFLKPLERGLETNLVLTTSLRVYLLALRSGAVEAFNAAIAWDAPETPLAVTPTDAVASGPVQAGLVQAGPVRPDAVLDARYRIVPRGRSPRWMPTAVFTDGVRTFISLPGEASVDEVPALFVLAADGQAQLVNYRQQDGLFVVDRVFDRAELRLGDPRPRVVRIERLTGGRP